MQFSRATDYGLLGLAALAREPDYTASVTDIARSEGLALAFLRKIFQKLAAAKLVESQRGTGYTLARRPELITARDVFDAVEGPICLQECLDNTATCGKSDYCRIKRVWNRVQTTLNAELGKITLAELV